MDTADGMGCKKRFVILKWTVVSANGQSLPSQADWDGYNGTNLLIGRDRGEGCDFTFKKATRTFMPLGSAVKPAGKTPIPFTTSLLTEFRQTYKVQGMKDRDCDSSMKD